MRVRPIEEAQYASLTDDELVRLIGSLWEHIKAIDERMREDEHIIRAEDEIKAYKDEKYLDEQKLFKAKLKASRAMAKARGLQFELPRRKGDE